MKTKLLLILPLMILAALLVQQGCAPFVDSPFSSELLSKDRDLNYEAMARLNQTDIEADGKIRIAIFADVHQNYVDLDQVVHEMNLVPTLDFVANLGDFTNSGYNLEYDQFLDSYSTIRAAKLSVTGNHDAIGSGPELFRKVFGIGDYFFESASHRFIFFNTANLENPGNFNPAWLKNAVDSSAKPVIIFTHCSLQDPERFTGSVAAVFDSVLQDAKVQLVLNGHNHVYSLQTYSGTVLLQSARVQGNTWMLLEISGTQLTITQKIDGTETVVALKP